MNKRIIDYKYFFFIGIGGIGMSALARYFNSFGKVPDMIEIALSLLIAEVVKSLSRTVKIKYRNLI